MNYKMAIGKRNMYCITMLYKTPYETETQKASALVWYKDGKVKSQYVNDYLQQQAYKKLCACKGLKQGAILVSKYTTQHIGNDLLII